MCRTYFRIVKRKFFVETLQPEFSFVLYEKKFIPSIVPNLRLTSRWLTGPLNRGTDNVSYNSPFLLVYYIYKTFGQVVC